MTDFAHRGDLIHLRPAETRLAAILSRPRCIAIACIAVLAAAGWISLALMSVDAGPLAALCRSVPPTALGDFAALLAMWVAMTLAMMLPTAGPMILTYTEIADTAARQGEAAVSPLMLGGGYLVVWLGFAVAMAALQAAIAGTIPSGGLGPLAVGALLVFAGAYQFSRFKEACLSQCRRPFPFFFANWSDRPAGVFALGIRQGLFCLGCCWALMLVMLASGTLNPVWMAALGALMAAEKLTTRAVLPRAAGGVLIATGIWIAVTGTV